MSLSQIYKGSLGKLIPINQGAYRESCFPPSNGGVVEHSDEQSPEKKLRPFHRRSTTQRRSLRRPHFLLPARFRCDELGSEMAGAGGVEL